VAASAGGMDQASAVVVAVVAVVVVVVALVDPAAVVMTSTLHSSCGVGLAWKQVPPLVAVPVAAAVVAVVVAVVEAVVALVHGAGCLSCRIPALATTVASGPGADAMQVVTTT